MFRRLPSRSVALRAHQLQRISARGLSVAANKATNGRLLNDQTNWDGSINHNRAFGTISIDKSYFNIVKIDSPYIRPSELFQPRNDLLCADLLCKSSTSSENRAPWSPTATCSAYDRKLDGLPHLPVPEVEQTINKLKDVVLPFAMNSFELANTLHLIDRFGTFIAPKLNELLRNKARQTQNWCTHDWWTTETYLRSRAPLISGSSPGIIYPRCPPTNGNRRTLNLFVARLVSALVDYRNEINNGTIEAEMRKNGMCHEQFTKMFGTTRIPQAEVDTIITKAKDCNSFKIVISFRNRFFELDLSQVADPQYRTQRIGIVRNAIDRIVEQLISDEIDNEIDPPIGTLTASRRDLWASAYKLINQDALDAINEAQFVLCLDTLDANDADIERLLIDHDQREYQRRIGSQVLHGDMKNMGNRWFDKTLQLIVVTDAKAEHLLGAGINYEHSMAEGIPISSLVDYSFKQVSDSITNNGQDMQLNLITDATLKPIKFVTGDEDELIQLKQCVEEAQQSVNTIVGQLELDVLNFSAYGKNLIKTFKLSPDSWIQVALAWAYYRLHQRMGACYESASVREFSHGRTETIRSMTNDVAQFCIKPNYESLITAIHSHKHYSNDARNGHGIDRVLLAYRMILSELRSGEWQWGVDGVDSNPQGEIFNERDQATISAFFNNELIQRSKRFALSTSQVGSTYPNVFMIYGPLTPDGYACCYNPTSNQITIAISGNSKNAIYSNDVGRLRSSIEQCLHDMKTMVEENQRTPTSKL